MWTACEPEWMACLFSNYGSPIRKRMIPAGQSSVQMDGSRLSRGLNIVNVEGDSMQDNSCKVIVK